MSKRIVVPLVILLSALLVGLGWTVHLMQKQREKDLAEQRRQEDIESLMHEKADVVFALQELPKGTVLTRNMLEPRQIECRYVPGSAVWNIGICIRRITKYPLHKGQLVEMQHLGLDKFDPEALSKWPPKGHKMSSHK